MSIPDSSDVRYKSKVGLYLVNSLLTGQLTTFLELIVKTAKTAPYEQLY